MSTKAEYDNMDCYSQMRWQVKYYNEYINNIKFKYNPETGIIDTHSTNMPIFGYKCELIDSKFMNALTRVNERVCTFISPTGDLMFRSIITDEIISNMLNLNAGFKWT
jgi:hypothetical protein